MGMQHRARSDSTLQRAVVEAELVERFPSELEQQVVVTVTAMVRLAEGADFRTTPHDHGLSAQAVSRLSGEA